MRDSERIVDVLKLVLRERGLTYRELGERIGLSEPTVKRMFSQRRITLDRLETVCDTLGLSLLELTRRASAQLASEIYRLTIAQERRLVADVELFYFFWMLVHRHSLASICRRYAVTDQQAKVWLTQLDRMGIIELFEGKRFALRISSNVVWNEDGPIERLIVSRSLPLFLKGRFRRDDEYFRFIVGKLSPESIMLFRSRLRELAEQIFEQSVGTDAMRADSKTAAVVVAIGPASFSLRDVVEGAP